jgi:hypothetical protein
MTQDAGRHTGFSNRLAGLLDHAAILATADQRLAPLRDAVELGRARVREPMRVAVVGQIKKGKSTLVNALLGTSVVPTGVLELTFNVNELLWSPTPTIEVEFTDRPPERRPFADLETLTARNTNGAAELRSIRVIRVGLPNPLLRKLRLLDTPGLNSVYQHDQENTLRALGISQEEVEESSARHLQDADAVLFLFSRSLAASSAALITDLHGPVSRNATPLKAIGVLSKCDDYWLEDGDGPLLERADHDPLAGGRRVCARLMRDPRISRLFYTVLPVCGLLAAGAAAITAEDTKSLTTLAAIPREQLIRALADAGTFATSSDAALALPSEQRRRLVELLGPYGIHVACDQLRNDTDENKLQETLIKASGVGDLSALLESHFGNRSAVIKADTLLRQLQSEINSAREQGPSRVVDLVADLIQQFRTDEPTFAEFDVLSAYYRRQLQLLPDEAEEILAVTGERGLSAPDRLGTPGTDPAGLSRICRERAAEWRQRATSPTENRGRRRALRTVARSYEALADEVERAAYFLGV